MSHAWAPFEKGWEKERIIGQAKKKAATKAKPKAKKKAKAKAKRR